MSFPPFIARFVRNFTQTSRLSLAPDLPGEASFATPTNTLPANIQRCTVASGCFWGTEHIYRKEFSTEAIVDAKVGYIGGDMSEPNYRAVCTGKTGHAEAAQFMFNPDKISYRELIEFFYRTHDPTTMNRQGPDTGPQYRSAIFYHNEEQERIARDVTARANKLWWNGKIVTEIVPAGKWWQGEKYHQLYLENNPSGYQCPSHFKRKDAECPPLY